jgi:hypothetical protein
MPLIPLNRTFEGEGPLLASLYSPDTPAGQKGSTGEGNPYLENVVSPNHTAGGARIHNESKYRTMMIIIPHPRFAHMG